VTQITFRYLKEHALTKRSIHFPKESRKEVNTVLTPAQSRLPRGDDCRLSEVAAHDPTIREWQMCRADGLRARLPRQSLEESAKMIQSETSWPNKRPALDAEIAFSTQQTKYAVRTVQEA